MLSLTLSASDLAHLPVKMPSGWTLGRGQVKPFQHPALHAECLSSARRTVIAVRERMRGAPTNLEHIGNVSEQALDNHVRDLRRWPLDFICLDITRTGAQAGVRLFCGRWGTAPVYLLLRGQVLHAHWDIAALYDKLSSTKLDPVFAAKYLVELDHPYSRRTIFPEISMLTERSSARSNLTLDNLAIKYPPAESHAEAARLKRGARATAAFRDILQAAMRMRILSDDQIVALELSGGLDSTIVAAAAATIHGPGVRSYGMIMPGHDGDWQQRRRDDTVRRFGLIDHTLPAVEHPPFGPTSSRVRLNTMIPFGEFYDEAVGSLMDLARADCVDTIFTGMGGDELCSLQFGEDYSYEEETVEDTEEDDDATEYDDAGEDDTPVVPTLSALSDEAYREGAAELDQAPQPLMYRSALESAAAVSALYLRKGIWPVSPLCTPELVEFCRRLPFHWRDDRTIHRKVLTSYGCPTLITQPTHLETFLDVMHRALSKSAAPLLTDIFKTPLLAEQGLIDAKRLRSLYRKYLSGDRQFEDQILAAAMLELTLRSAENRIKGRSGLEASHESVQAAE